MSAFIVSENHINVIVSWFIDPRKDEQLWYELNGEYGYMDKDAAAVVAQVLYSENVRSVNERYDDMNSDENYEFEYIPHARQAYSIGEIAKAIDCLDYQSCETDDYHQTAAYKIMNSMRNHLLKRVADREGVDLWEITDVKGKFHMAEA